MLDEILNNIHQVLLQNWKSNLILRQLWLHSETTEELILFCLHGNLIDMTQTKNFGTRYGQLLELFLYIPGGLVVLDESMGNLH